MKKIIVLSAILCTTIAFAGDKYDTSWTLNVTGEDGIATYITLPTPRCENCYDLLADDIIEQAEEELAGVA